MTSEAVGIWKGKGGTKMGVTQFMNGRSAALDLAERELHEEENRVFTIEPDEMAEVPIHARADVRRFTLLVRRQAFYNALSSARTDRNLAIYIGGFAILFAKLFGGFDVAMKLIQAL